MPRFTSTELAGMTLAVLCGLVLIASRPAEAQTETVLYNFCSQPNCADGANPTSRLTSDGKGNLYGTTYFGGIGSCIDDNGVGCGTVFELDRTGSETVLYSFTGGADGANASGPVIFDSKETFTGPRAAAQMDTASCSNSVPWEATGRKPSFTTLPAACGRWQVR